MQGQVNIQTQQQLQTQKLQQRLSPTQLQVVRLLEMPIAQLEQEVMQKLDNNPSLEAAPYDDSYTDQQPSAQDTDTEQLDDMALDERERREDALNDALDNFGNDDRMEGTTYSDDYIPGSNTEQRTYENGNTTSFMDTLISQMHEIELTDEERQVMEYLIGSLDDDGLLHKDLQTISDELAIYNYINVSPDDIETVLMKLQEFDPAGVGTRSLKECLLTQIERMTATDTTMLMFRVIDECFDEFTSNHWDRIRRRLGISQQQADDVRSEIRRRLNPKPGAAFGEVQGRSLHEITPDVIISVDYENNITFELNNGRVPRLRIVKEDEQMCEEIKRQQGSAGNNDAIRFLQHNIDDGRLYIEALRQREQTIIRTVAAIINLQRQYLLSGDESDLRPMVLKDVAQATGFDLSTISRVSREKYAQTPWGMFPLRHFFNEAYTTDDGTTMSTREIKQALREVVEAEDPHHPLSDNKLSQVMTAKGYPIARRTITKYREQLSIPEARLRKQ